ncbi:hypothetical protein LINGRAHAP2_LOCUS6826 [Linum grandiflorum]
MDDRRAQVDCAFFLAEGAISRGSKQSIVTLPTTKVEFVAAFYTAAQCLWMRRILEQIE